MERKTWERDECGETTNKIGDMGKETITGIAEPLTNKRQTTKGNKDLQLLAMMLQSLEGVHE